MARPGATSAAVKKENRRALTLAEHGVRSTVSHTRRDLGGCVPVMPLGLDSSISQPQSFDLVSPRGPAPHSEEARLSARLGARQLTKAATRAPPVLEDLGHGGSTYDDGHVGVDLHNRLLMIRQDFDSKAMVLNMLREKHRADKGITIEERGAGRVDVSGRKMSIRNFAGRKRHSSTHEMVGELAKSSPRFDVNGAERSDHHRRMDARIGAWRMRTHSGAGHSLKWLNQIREAGVAVGAHTEQKRRSTIDEDEDDHIVLSQYPSALKSGSRSFMLGMVEPQQIPADVHNDMEASDQLLAALRTPPKDRQYEELEHIIQYMEHITAEPFASMNEFEKLKAAMLCEIDDKASHGKAIIKRGEQPQKLYVLIRGRAASFNFRTAVVNLDKERRAALAKLRHEAQEKGEPLNIDRFQEEWTEKSHHFFDQTYRLIDQLESGTLPPGTLHVPHAPGFVCGHQVFRDACLSSASSPN